MARPVSATRTAALAAAARTGTLTAMARALGVSRATAARYAQRWPDVREALAAAREALVDLAEEQLRRAVEQGDLRVVLFVLRTLGRGRGYGPPLAPAAGGGRIELSWADGTPVDVT
jgi:hypothetical protein